jgi:hypothetical protein
MFAVSIALFSFTVTVEMKDGRNERTKLNGTWDVVQYMKREKFLKHDLGFLYSHISKQDPL